MTEEQIQEYLNALDLEARAKGLATPRFQIEFESNTKVQGYYSYETSEAAGSGRTSDWVYGADVLNICQKIRLHIKSIPSKEERERTEYLKKVSAALEYGKKVGIDDSLINPLIEQMKKLSSNIIEHKPAEELNDEIPF